MLHTYKAAEDAPFAELRGTRIETANKYANDTAESIPGELLAADPDHFVDSRERWDSPPAVCWSLDR